MSGFKKTDLDIRPDYKFAKSLTRILGIPVIGYQVSHQQNRDTGYQEF